MSSVGAFSWKDFMEIYWCIALASPVQTPVEEEHVQGKAAAVRKAGSEPTVRKQRGAGMGVMGEEGVRSCCNVSVIPDTQEPIVSIWWAVL